MAGVLLAVASAEAPPSLLDMAVELAGSNNEQNRAVTVVHVAKVWGTSLGLQHPALRPNSVERSASRDAATSVAAKLRQRGVRADALLTSGRDVGKAVAAAARHVQADIVVVGKSRGGRLEHLLKGSPPSVTLQKSAGCRVVVVEPGP